MIKRYICPIPSSVLLHLNYFKVVQGQVTLSAPVNTWPISDSWLSSLFLVTCGV